MPWIVIVICCAFSVLTCLFNQSYSKVMSYALMVMFSTVCTLYYFNGVDWLNYYYVFDYFQTDFDIRYDLLFNFYLYFMANITGIFQLTIYLFYVFTFYLLYRLTTVSFITINGPAFITCVVLLGGLSLVLDQVRQFAAICVGFFACNSLLNNNRRGFYKYLIVAVLFHYSAIFVLLFRFFYNASKRRIILSGLAIIVIFIFSGGIILLNLGLVANIPFVGVELYRKAAIYTRELDSFKAEIGFGVLADILIIGYYIIRRESCSSLDKLWALAFISSCFHVGFYFMPAFSRFNYFAFLPLAYIFSHAFTTSRNKMGFVQVGVIVAAVSLMIIIVTVKTFTDPNRPSWHEYSIDAAFYNNHELDELRSTRCAALENDVSDFCATY